MRSLEPIYLLQTIIFFGIGITLMYALIYFGDKKGWWKDEDPTN